MRRRGKASTSETMANNFTGLTIGSRYGSQDGSGAIENMRRAQASLAGRKLQQSLAMAAQNGIRRPNRIQTPENLQRSSKPPASLPLGLAVERPHGDCVRRWRRGSVPSANALNRTRALSGKSLSGSRRFRSWANYRGNWSIKIGDRNPNNSSRSRTIPAD
jgi:hypothetical protein